MQSKNIKKENHFSSSNPKDKLKRFSLTMKLFDIKDGQFQEMTTVITFKSR